MDTLAQTAMAALQTKPVTPPTAPGRLGASQSGQSNKNAAAMDKAAKEFESVFVSQFLGSMFSGISTDGPFGGGQGEEMFRSLMIDQYSAGIEKQGGFGLSSSIKHEMLKMQGGA